MSGYFFEEMWVGDGTYTSGYRGLLALQVGGCSVRCVDGSNWCVILSVRGDDGISQCYPLIRGRGVRSLANMAGGILKVQSSILI